MTEDLPFRDGTAAARAARRAAFRTDWRRRPGHLDRRHDAAVARLIAVLHPEPAATPNRRLR